MPRRRGCSPRRSATSRVLLVLDELERLGEAREAWAVIEALLRYAPAEACASC